jgi:hypothetical protein
VNPRIAKRARAVWDVVGIDGVLTALVVIVCANVPLLAGPGIESALVLGVVVPPAIAGRAAARASMRGDAYAARIADACLRAATLAVVASALLVVRSLVGDACAPFAGLVYMALGPLAGFVFAALVGVVAQRLARTRRRAITLAVTIPLSFIVLGGYELYATPGVFLYSPFAGHLPGVLYDRTLGLPPPYLTYRLASALAMIGLGALTTMRGPAWAEPRRFAIGWLGLGLAAACSFSGPSLGHRASVAHIRETLGARVDTERCVLYVPREMHIAERRRHARDCDFHVASIERWLGVRRSGRAEVYFYRSAEEKRRLMGAADTDVAKPWRGEAHLVSEPWPHPVLRHELAHVVAAEVGSGPFRIAGSGGGLVPSPGLIEGLAVAASGESRDGLGPDAWSHAMLELEILPSMQTLLGLGFLGEAPSTAYVASGSSSRSSEGPRDAARSATRTDAVASMPRGSRRSSARGTCRSARRLSPTARSRWRACGSNAKGSSPRSVPTSSRACVVSSASRARAATNARSRACVGRYWRSTRTTRARASRASARSPARDGSARRAKPATRSRETIACRRP